ncbi:Zn2/Cys6 DNA-binding protein, partial [Penicillium odoratum]|uniref:Zn2/Cys6 DNA-binding protein n=1 Tax=Penicillium odoratum TaxID=1167516 RepID=UPI0025486733
STFVNDQVIKWEGSPFSSSESSICFTGQITVFLDPSIPNIHNVNDMSSPISSADTRSSHIHPEARRRKLRKGTFSCWECKRRKIRCILDPNRDSRICNGCRNRGTRYISQAFPGPEDVAPHGLARNSCGSTVGDRYSPLSRDDYSIPTPASLSTEPTHAFAFYQASNETATIYTASRHPALLSHEIMIMPYMALEKDGIRRTTALLEIPYMDAHPVLIAKYMLLLASLLQLLHIEQNDHTSQVERHSGPPHAIMVKGLSEPPRVIMERLVNLTVKLVTTNDELLGSLEGLEYIMIETLYQSNIGNLRRACISCRRAFRIVFMDRYLSLMLGTSEGCLNRNIASDAMLAGATPIGRLKRIHYEIAS